LTAVDIRRDFRVPWTIRVPGAHGVQTPSLVTEAEGTVVTQHPGVPWGWNKEMAKDVVLGKSREEAGEYERVWSMEWGPYRELQKRVEERQSFPILGSITAYDEGVGGDFVIGPNQVPDLIREVESLLAGERISNDLKDMLHRLKRLGLRAGKSGLTIFGFAD
jgi:hypothetical protein